MDGKRPTSLRALGPLTNLHSLQVMSRVSSFQQNPQLGATFESWSFTVPGAVLHVPAPHAVQLWTKQERHRMFCTPL